MKAIIWQWLPGFLIFLVGFPTTILANATYPLGHYLSLDATPTHAQQDLLSQTVQMRFPPSIQTVGDAMTALLRFTGYSLVPTDQQSPTLQKTLQKPLPFVDRTLQPMPLRSALSILVGSAFVLQDDVLNREINFAVKPAYIHHHSNMGKSYVFTH